MPTVAEVTATANRVVEATTKARMQAEPGVGSMLSFGVFRGAGDDAAVNNLRQIEQRAMEWRTRGIDAAKTGKPPNANNSWADWTKAGQILADGAADQLGETKWILPAIAETLAKAPSHVKEDVKKGAAVVGDVAAGAAEGFLSKAWWVVGIALIGLGAYLYVQKKVLRG